MNSNNLFTAKCVIVGDGAVGKTCLLYSYAKGEFPKSYVPTIFDNYSTTVDVAGKPITLILFDTAGQEDYDRLRPLSYANSNVFLVCFSIGSRTSFENVKDKWVPELRKHAPTTPILLVGTQSDRRQSPGTMISESEARKLARSIKAAGYMECSAKSRDGVKAVFSEAVLVALDPLDRTRKNMKGVDKGNRATVREDPSNRLMTVHDQEKLSSVHPFLEYIESIVPSLPAFYSQPILSLLAYRFLPELSQQVVNKLLYYSGPIPFQEVRTWFRPAHKAIQNKTLWRLKQLQILQGRGQEVWINETFQRSLFTGFSKLAMKRGGRESRDSDSYARDKWEMVLYELVKGENGSSSGEGVSKRPRLQSTGSSLERLLTDSGLISTTGRVTNSGFQFLLKDISNQIWVLLIHYLKKLSPEQVEANLGFLGEQVLFGQAGRTIGGLQSIDLELYEQFGLVIPGGGRDFSATRLFTSLAGGKNALDFSQTGAESRGFLVVETNYRIYAYTSSPLQIATLGLFIRLQDRFPNLVFGQLDMETVQGAMSHGITADQIVDYLQINVHPCMLEGQSGVPFNGIPFTIIDQIKLWEMGRNRLANNREGYLYQQFLSEKEYDAALGEAKEINALLYAKPASRLLIISPDGHEHMKQFIKSIKQ